MLASDLGKLSHFMSGARQEEEYITSQCEIGTRATSAEDFHKLLMVRDAKWLVK